MTNRSTDVARGHFVSQDYHLCGVILQMYTALSHNKPQPNNYQNKDYTHNFLDILYTNKFVNLFERTDATVYLIFYSLRINKKKRFVPKVRLELTTPACLNEYCL